MESFMLRCAVASLCLASVVVAQVSRGPFIGVPVHHVVAGDTLGPGSVLLDTDELYLKRAGFVDLAASVPFVAPRPIFTQDAMFGPSRPVGFQIDALSSGYCTVFCSWDVAGDPVLTIPAGAWGGLLFSVSRNSPGGDAPVVVNEALRPDGAGADVFSVILPGSTLPLPLSCVPIGVAQRANDSSEMGFSHSPTSKPEIGDFDPFLPFYEVEGPMPAYLTASPWVYFSVPTSVAASVASWFTMRDTVLLPDPPSGATILRTQWVSTAPSPYWTPPEVFLTYSELGLLVNDDIDALSVQESNFPLPGGLTGGGVLFSLRNPPPPAPALPIGKQLMVAGYRTVGAVWNVVPARTYYYDDGTDSKEPAAKIAGAGGGGEIDAACEFDPSNANGVAGKGFPYVRACRTDLGPSFPTTMHASAFPTASAAPNLFSVAVSCSGFTAPVFSLWGVALLPVPPAGPLPPTLNYLFLWANVETTPRRSWTFSADSAAAASAAGMELEFQVASMDLSFQFELARVIRVRL